LVGEEKKRGKCTFEMQARRPTPSPEHVVSPSGNTIFNEGLVRNRIEWVFVLEHCSLCGEKYAAIESVLSHSMMHITLSIGFAGR
jgi:hypothetical protein